MFSHLARTFSEDLRGLRSQSSLSRKISFNDFNASIDDEDNEPYCTSLASYTAARRDSLDSMSSTNTDTGIAVEAYQGALLRSSSVQSRPSSTPVSPSLLRSTTAPTAAIPVPAPLPSVGSAPVAAAAAAPVSTTAPTPGSGAAAMAAAARRRHERYTIQGMDAYDYCDMIRSL